MKTFEKTVTSCALVALFSISAISNANAQGIETVIGFGNFVLDSMSSKGDLSSAVALQNYNLLVELSGRMQGVEDGLVALYKEIGASEERIKSFVTSSFNTNDAKSLIAVAQTYITEIQQLEAERDHVLRVGGDMSALDGRIVKVSEDTAVKISELRNKLSLGTYLSAPTVSATASVEIFARLKAGQNESLAVFFEELNQYFNRALDSNVKNSIANEINQVKSVRDSWVGQVHSRLDSKSLKTGFYGKSCVLYATHQRFSTSSNNPGVARTIFHSGIELTVRRENIADTYVEFFSIPKFPSVRVTSLDAANFKKGCIDKKQPDDSTGKPIHQLAPFPTYSRTLREVQEANSAGDALFTLLSLRQQVGGMRSEFEAIKEKHSKGLLFPDDLTRSKLQKPRDFFEQYVQILATMQNMEAGQSRNGLRNMMEGYRNSQERSRAEIAKSEIAIASAINNSVTSDNLAVARQLLSYVSYAVKLKKMIGKFDLEDVEQGGEIEKVVNVEEHAEADGLTVISGPDAVTQGYSDPLHEVRNALNEYDALGAPKRPDGPEWTAHEEKLEEIFQLVRGQLNYQGVVKHPESFPRYVAANDILKPSLAKSVGVFFSILFDPVVLGDAVVDWRDDIDEMNNEIAKRTQVLFDLRDPGGNIIKGVGELPRNLTDPLLFKCLSEPCWQSRD